jgi:hypothetical protein
LPGAQLPHHVGHEAVGLFLTDSGPGWLPFLRGPSTVDLPLVGAGLKTEITELRRQLGRPQAGYARTHVSVEYPDAIKQSREHFGSGFQ